MSLWAAPPPYGGRKGCSQKRRWIGKTLKTSLLTRRNPICKRWEIAQILDGASIVAPESARAVQGVITHIGQGEPHRASMDEMDYQLFDAIKGEV